MADRCIQWQAVAAAEAPPIEPLLEQLAAIEPPPPRALALPAGTAVFTGDPVWQVQLPHHAEFLDGDPTGALGRLDALLRRELPCRRLITCSPIQLYRQLDDHGRFRRDLILPLDADPVPGMVLMQTIWLDGRAFLPETPPWLAYQSRALPETPGTYPVEHHPEQS